MKKIDKWLDSPVKFYGEDGTCFENVIHIDTTREEDAYVESEDDGILYLHEMDEKMFNHVETFIEVLAEEDDETSFWGEIRCDYLNPEGYWTVDAWKTFDDNEEGKVIAAIDDETGKVFYVDGCAESDKYAQEVINAKVAEIKNR